MPGTLTKSLRAAHTLAIAAAAAALTFPVAAQAGEVSLNGEGSVQYTPDSARLQFTATAEHPLAARATEQVNDLMARWRQATTDLRPQLNDYSDAMLNLYSRNLPAPERGQPGTSVAVASQTVSFSISDLALLNPLLEQAQALGLNYHLGPQQFYHSDEQALQQQALARAIADARTRCQFVAEQLEMSCGDVKTININGGFRPVPMMMAEAKAAGDAVSSVGPRELTASVSATFELN